MIENEDEDDFNLINEEKSLMEELKMLQEKHENVNLIYEKVSHNIKNICSIEKWKENNKEKNLDTEEENKALNKSGETEPNVLKSSTNIIYSEEEILKCYKDIIGRMKSSYMDYLSKDKDEFLSLLKSKQIPNLKLESVKKSNTAKLRNAGMKEMKPISQEELFMKNFLENKDFDEDLMNEERMIKNESDVIAFEYKEKERQKIYEKMKRDNVDKSKTQGAS
jgi:hypothetical protein